MSECRFSQKQTEQIVDQILTIAYDLLVAGSEVGRTEQQISRMCQAYGMEEVEVFIITSSILVSVTNADGSHYTQSKRIRTYHTDFYRIELLEHLCSYICKHTPSKEAILVYRDRISETVKMEHRWKGTGFTYGNFCIISMVFTWFFGGSFFDGIASFLCGFFIKHTLTRLERNVSNRFVCNVISSLAGGFTAWIFYKIGLANAIDKVIIGNIMLLIPGLATVNAFKDLVSGEMISGLLRLADALIQAIAIAIGFALILLPMGG